jgi:hypothetical protein
VSGPKLLNKPLEDYPKSWRENPCGKELTKEYEHALEKTEVLTGKDYDEYGTLWGVLNYGANYMLTICRR